MIDLDYLAIGEIDWRLLSAAPAIAVMISIVPALVVATIPDGYEIRVRPDE